MIWVTELWRSQADLDASLERIRGSDDVAAAMALVEDWQMIELDLLGRQGAMRKLVYGMRRLAGRVHLRARRRHRRAAPDEELHRFHNRQARATGANVLRPAAVRDDALLGDGRSRTAGTRARSTSSSRVWKETRRLVFSPTLDEREG